MNCNPEKIRIVRIIDRLNIGGPAKHVTWLTAGMNNDRFDTVLVTGTVPPGEGDMGWFAREAGLEPLVISEMSREPGPQDLLVIAKLVRLLYRLRPDVIHTHKAKAGAVGRVAAMIYKWAVPSALWLRPRRCAIIHTFHGHTFHSYFSPLKTRLFILIERMLATFGTDRIITISEQQRAEINGRFGVGKSARFSVIPLGIDFDEIREKRGRLRREYGIREDEVLIGIVGRLCEVKNHAMFLEVSARLSREGLNARFIVIGGGHLQSELEAQARRLGLTDQVIFTGFREDATELYGDLDIVALTSLNEGTPLTLIEGMGCGRAVVATEVGGVTDLMGGKGETRDGFTVRDHGLTAPSRDVTAFAQALRCLIQAPELRQAMGERGRRFVRARLSKERLIGDMSVLYQEMLGLAVSVESSSSQMMVAADEQRFG
ncbi:MAG: glycosyltransferase [Blastocatellia bacterium]